MGKFMWVVLLAFCLLVIDAKKKTAEPVAKEDTPATPDAEVSDDAADDNDKPAEDSAKAEDSKDDDDDDKTENADAKDTEPKEDKEDAPEEETAEATESTNEEAEQAEAAPEMSCNLKFKRVGCYADNSKKDRPLRSYIMSDADIGTISKKGKMPKGEHFNSELPKFACKCANEAINAGNAVFGIQNLAECWTGPDDSKYDKDGASEECVTFNYAKCEGNSEMCAGKKHANFVYYVDTPEHTKTKEEIAKEYAQYKQKVAAHHKKKNSQKKKAAKKLKAKKAKKAKKE